MRGLPVRALDTAITEVFVSNNDKKALEPLSTRGDVETLKALALDDQSKNISYRATLPFEFSSPNCLLKLLGNPPLLPSIDARIFYSFHAHNQDQGPPISPLSDVPAPLGARCQ